MEDSLMLMTTEGDTKIPTQSLEDILTNRIILPNTKSFGHEPRLACSNLAENYTTTYRGQGVVFQTSQQPDYVAPFDLAVLTKSDHVLTQYYRIEKNIAEYYNRELIDGFERFRYSSVEEMLMDIESPEIAFEKVNQFRQAAGYKPLPKNKKKLFQYNEVIFHQPVNLDFVGIFGRLPELKQFSEIFTVPRWRSAKDFREWYEIEREKLGRESNIELNIQHRTSRL